MNPPRTKELTQYITESLYEYEGEIESDELVAVLVELARVIQYDNHENEETEFGEAVYAGLVSAKNEIERVWGFPFKIEVVTRGT